MSIRISTMHHSFQGFDSGADANGWPRKSFMPKVSEDLMKSLDRCPLEIYHLVFEKLCERYTSPQIGIRRMTALPRYSQVSRDWREIIDKHLPWPYNIPRFIASFNFEKEREVAIREASVTSATTEQTSDEFIYEESRSLPRLKNLKYFWISDEYDGIGAYSNVLYLQPLATQLELVTAILKHDAKTRTPRSCWIVVIVNKVTWPAFFGAQGTSAEQRRIQHTFQDIVEHLLILYERKPGTPAPSITNASPVTLPSLKSLRSGDVQIQPLVRLLGIDIPNELERLTITLKDGTDRLTLFRCSHYAIWSSDALLLAADLLDGSGFSLLYNAESLQDFQARKRTVFEWCFPGALPPQFDPTIIEINRQFAEYSFVLLVYSPTKMIMRRMPTIEARKRLESLITHKNGSLLGGLARFTRGSLRVVFHADAE